MRGKLTIQADMPETQPCSLWYRLCRHCSGEFIEKRFFYCMKVVKMSRPYKRFVKIVLLLVPSEHLEGLFPPKMQK